MAFINYFTIITCYHICSRFQAPISCPRCLYFSFASLPI